jgi:hypothetical protein
MIAPPQPEDKPKTRPASKYVGKIAAEKPVNVKKKDCWEYRTASFQEHQGWRLRFIDGAEVKDWTGAPLLHEYLRLMGEEGWELAGAASGESLYGSMDKYQLFFARPKTPSR